MRLLAPCLALALTACAPTSRDDSTSRRESADRLELTYYYLRF